MTWKYYANHPANVSAFPGLYEVAWRLHKKVGKLFYTPVIFEEMLL